MMCGEAWLKYGDPWKHDRATQDRLSSAVPDKKQEPRIHQPKVVKQQQTRFDF